MPAYQALLLDMDGVVIDSEPLHEEAQRIIFREYDLDVPESEFPGFKGMRETEVFERIVRDYANGNGDIDDLVAAKERAYRGLLHDLPLIPNALAFIRRAHAMYRLALTTSSVRIDQEIAFNTFNLWPYFEVIVTAEDIDRPKPDPQPYLTTVEKLRLDPSDCLVVEDSINGVLSAVAAGCAVVGMTTSFDASILEEAGADLVVEGFHDLARHLEMAWTPSP